MIQTDGQLLNITPELIREYAISDKTNVLECVRYSGTLGDQEKTQLNF